MIVAPRNQIASRSTLRKKREGWGPHPSKSVTVLYGRRHKALVLLHSPVSFQPRFFAEPMPAWFGKTAVTPKKRVNGRIHRYMALGNFCASGDKSLNNLRVDLRIASMRRRPKRLAEHGASVLIFDFKRGLVFQQQLDGIEPAKDRRTVQTGLSVATVRRHVDVLAQQEFNCFSPSMPTGIAESRFHLLFGYAWARSPIRKKELPHQLDAAHARSRDQVDVRAPFGQELGCARLTVVQTSPDGRRV